MEGKIKVLEKLDFGGSIAEYDKVSDGTLCETQTAL